MTTLNFPSNPALNQTYTSGGKTWKWSGSSWVSATYLESAIVVSDTKPTDPANTQFWWDTNSGILKIYYNDGSSTQWVDAFYNPYADYITQLEYIQSTFASLQNEVSIKASLTSPTFTGDVVLPATTTIGTVTSEEIGHLDGVTSGVQTQLNSKANSASPTFTGTVTAPTLNLTNSLEVQYGGTGTNTLSTNSVLLGNGTSSVQSVAPGTNGNVLTSNGTTWVSTPTASSFTTGKAIAMAMIFGG